MRAKVTQFCPFCVLMTGKGKNYDSQNNNGQNRVKLENRPHHQFNYITILVKEILMDVLNMDTVKEGSKSCNVQSTSQTAIANHCGNDAASGDEPGQQGILRHLLTASTAGLSNNDSYDHPHTVIAEGVSPLESSPIPVHCVKNTGTVKERKVGQSDQKMEPSDERVSLQSEREEDYFGGSSAKGLSVSVDQHRTPPRQFASGYLEEDDDDAQTLYAVNDVHKCQLCELTFASNKHLESHVERTHGQRQSRNIDCSTAGKSSDSDFDCCEEDDDGKLSESVRRHGSENRDGGEEEGLEGANGSFGDKERLRWSTMSEGRESFDVDESGHGASNRVHLDSGLSRQEYGISVGMSGMGEAPDQESDGGVVGTTWKEEGTGDGEATECSKSGDSSNMRDSVYKAGNVGRRPSTRKRRSGEGSSQTGDAQGVKRGAHHPGGENQFICNECGRTYRYISMLNVHMRTHTGEKPFGCSECGKRFNRTGDLHSHMRTHRGEKPFKCNECGKAFNESGTLYKHIRIHTGEKPFKCIECGKEFSQNGSLHRHLKTHATEKPFKCEECGKAFGSANSFQKHAKTHVEEKPSECFECGKVFNDGRSLLKHLRTHLGSKRFECDLCYKTFGRRENLQRHTRTHTGEKPYKCDECGKTFSVLNYLHKHLSTHTEEKPFKCSECGKTFRTSSHIHRHMRTHTGEKPYECAECGKVFAQRESLQRHTRSHTGEQPYACSDCGKTFALFVSFSYHMRTHTGEKPFKCDQCGKTFRSSSHLTGHMRIHTGEKPFKCKVCSKAFSESSSLHGHMRTHTGERPFECNECGRTFSQRYSLNMHMTTHSGERPFGCPVCGKMFTRNGDMKSHMQTHSGEKPFECNECGKTFNQSSYLNRHMKRHEKGFAYSATSL